MRSVLVCTVGTSLKANLEKEQDRKFSDLLADRNVQGLATALAATDPLARLAGAEINSNAGILQKGLLDERLHLYLLVSDTEDGALIGSILKAYYERRKAPWAFENVHVETVRGLTDQSPRKFRSQGLKNLVKMIAKIVQRHHASGVLINATGGYKAQISFAGMIGQALEIPVCYLFEKFSEVIELPPQPIAMDMSFWLDNAPLFFELEKKGTDFHPSENDPRFESLVELYEKDGDERLYGLTAVGQLFHETFQYRFQKRRKSLLPKESGIEPDNKILKFEDGNAGRHKGLEPYLNKIRQKPYVIRIYTHYFNPRLALTNYFRPSTGGDPSKVEGGYSEGKAVTKFDIVTTAETEEEQKAVLVDFHSTNS